MHPEFHLRTHRPLNDARFKQKASNSTLCIRAATWRRPSTVNYVVLTDPIFNQSGSWISNRDVIFNTTQRCVDLLSHTFQSSVYQTTPALDHTTRVASARPRVKTRCIRWQAFKNFKLCRMQVPIAHADCRFYSFEIVREERYKILVWMIETGPSVASLREFIYMRKSLILCVAIDAYLKRPKEAGISAE